MKTKGLGEASVAAMEPPYVAKAAVSRKKREVSTRATQKAVSALKRTK